MDHPREVALLSTREGAPHTRTSGDNAPDSRSVLASRATTKSENHADNCPPVGFVGKREAMLARQKKRTWLCLAFDLRGDDPQCKARWRAKRHPQLVDAVHPSRASHVYVLGQRSSFARGVPFSIRSRFSGRVTLVDGAGGTGIDRRQAGRTMPLSSACGLYPADGRLRATQPNAAWRSSRLALAPIARLRVSIVVSTRALLLPHHDAGVRGGGGAAALLAADAGDEALSAIARSRSRASRRRCLCHADPQGGGRRG